MYDVTVTANWYLNHLNKKIAINMNFLIFFTLQTCFVLKWANLLFSEETGQFESGKFV